LLIIWRTSVRIRGHFKKRNVRHMVGGSDHYQWRFLRFLG
jgi:hypothetical protein